MTPYASLEAFRAYLRISAPEDTSDDGLCTQALNAARTAIDRAAGRRFDVAGAVESRVFTSRIDPKTYRTVIDIDDTFSEAEDMDLAYDPLQEGVFSQPVTGDFRVWPFNAALTERPYFRIILNRATALPIGEVEVTTAWGWNASPDTIVTANLVQASRYLKRRDAPFGVAGSPEMGNEMRLLARLDPDVAVMVADYKRWA